MTRARKKTVVPPLNKQEAEKVMNTYAVADAQLEQLNAQMDEEITAIRDKNAERCKELEDSKKLAFQKMQMYAETNPELFKSKKSYETSHGTIGFRTGTPKVKTLRGYTLAAVLKLLKAKKATKYIRTKEEAAKEIFIANRDLPECKTLMTEVGLQIVQEDTFYIDLKKEEKSENL